MSEALEKAADAVYILPNSDREDARRIARAAITAFLSEFIESRKAVAEIARDCAVDENHVAAVLMALATRADSE